MEKISLGKLIFKQYARSALIVILTIETLLLLVYFLSNWFLIHRTRDILIRQARQMLEVVVDTARREVEEKVQLVEARTELLAKSHEVLFANPEAVKISGEQPVFAQALNGTWHQASPKNGSSLFVARSGRWGEEERRFATNSMTIDPLYRRLVEPPVVAAYINTPDDLNRLFPFIDKVWEQYPVDLHMEDYNFYYLADGNNNPERVPVWTEIYNDPAGNGVMVSCVAPVYFQDELKGVVGLDINTEEFSRAFDLVSSTDVASRSATSWKPQIILIGQDPQQKGTGDGTIFAVPQQLQGLLGWEEQGGKTGQVTDESLDADQLKKRAIANIRDPKVRVALQQLLKNPSETALQDVQTKQGRYFMAARSLQGLSGSKKWTWFVFALKNQSEVLEPVHKLARQAWTWGLAILAAMALFYLWFFQFLRKRARRMAVMIASPMQSELRAKDTELAYTRGLYESASGYLHNVGNAITRMESSLMDLDKVIKSSEQYPEAFDRIKAGGPAGAETLKRFEGVLVGKTVPALKSVADSIARIKDSIRNAISHQQAGFKAAVRQASEEVDLSELLTEMCALFRKEHPALSAEVQSGICVRGHRDPLVQGLDNIIRNAIQASPPGGHIHVTCEGAKDGALVTVTDEGRGISAGDLAKVTRAGFTTKQGGHGLGLHSFAVFLSASGGRLAVKSKGLGKGTTVNVDIRNA